LHHEAVSNVKNKLPIIPTIINNKTTEIPITVLFFFRIPYAKENKSAIREIASSIEEDMT
jgi:hypothetical protein